MMKRTMVLLVFLLLAAGTAAVAPAAALKVDGARIALDVEAGKTYDSTIGISIGANEAEGDFAVDVLGFGQSVTDGTYTGLAAAADTSMYSARPFITIDKPSVHVKPGERAAVTASIAVPAGTRDGGRYAIILVHPAASSSGAPASFATAVAIPVLLTMKGGTISEKGDIATVEMSATEVSKPFTVTSTVQNTGNYHYYGTVTNVTVVDSSGGVVANVTTTPMIRAIIPGNSVKIPATVAPGLPAGTYKMTVAMQTQDGTVLAQKTSDLTIGTPPSAGGTAGSGTPGTATAGAQAKPTQSPGSGPLAIIFAVAVGIVGAMHIRQKRE